MSFSVLNPCKASLHTFTETLNTRRTSVSVSLYDVLRVNQNASPVEIKMAYRSLAKVYHPDLCETGSDGGDFMKIHNAYSTLLDPQAREVYDLSLCVGTGRRVKQQQSGYYRTRKWETDQCW